jgi:hypothetical protein
MFIMQATDVQINLFFKSFLTLKTVFLVKKETVMGLSERESERERERE